MGSLSANNEGDGEEEDFFGEEESVGCEDWRTTLQFSPLNAQHFPVELFVTILEQEASANGWSASELSERTLSLVDCIAESERRKLLASGKEWPEIKAYLINAFSQKESLLGRVHLLKSLTKATDEKYHHFLARVKHFCGIFQRHLDRVDSFETLLFLAGLQDFELDLCNLDDLSCPAYSSPNKVDVLVDILSHSASVKSEIPESVAAEHESMPVMVKTELTKKESPSHEVKGDPDFDPSGFDADFYHPSDDDEAAIDGDEEEEKPLARKKRTKKSLSKKRLDENEVSSPSKKIYKKTPTPCEHCDMKFRTKSELYKHVAIEHRKYSKQTCQLCHETFSKSALEKHCLKEHNGMAVKCDTCGDLFPSAVKLKHHVENIHNSEKFKDIERRAALGEVVIENNPRQEEPAAPLEPEVQNFKDRSRKSVYKCALCPAVIESVQEYTKHCTEHHGGNRCKCDYCDFSSKNVKNVLEHRLKMHNLAWGNTPVYHCKIAGGKSGGSCTFKTYSPFRLTAHINMNHEKLHVVKCQVCSKECSSNGTLKWHVQTVHMGIKQFKCNICDYQCSGKKNLEIHKLTHLSQDERQKFICDECGSEYSNLVTLRAHKRKVHKGERNVKCPHCPGKMFFRNTELLAHLRTVHQLDKKYPCSHCDKGFESNYAAKRHEKIVHLKIKSFHCKLCNVLCSSSSNLSYHIAMRHLGLKKSEVKKNLHVAQQHEAFEVIGQPRKKDKVNNSQDPANHLNHVNNAAEQDPLLPTA